MIRPVVVLALVLGVACHAPAARPAITAAPLATPLAARIPADALMVIAIGPAGAADVDALARALGAPVPGEFAPPGGLWILLDAEATSTARCEAAAAGLEASLVGRGGAVTRSGGATLIELGDTITVLEGDVSCTVASGAASRRARHAVRLAGLGPGDELLADPAARAALAALPTEAAVVAWGPGDVIGGGLDAGGLDLAATLGALGDLAVALSIDPASHELTLTLHPAGHGTALERAAHRTAIGVIAQPPQPEALAALPVPPRDENRDVPESAAYREALQRVTRVLFAAAELATEIAAREEAATAAWVGAWGEAEIRGDGGAITVRWSPPAWPPAQIRAAADAAREVARDGLDELRARHATRVAEAEAALPELVKIRARDVAAFDRASRSGLR